MADAGVATVEEVLDSDMVWRRFANKLMKGFKQLA